MIVKKKNYMYTNNRKYVQGSGFMSDVGSYILNNKDLIAKPLLGAVGNIGAMALTEGSRWAVNKLMNSALQAPAVRNAVQAPAVPASKLDAKSKQIIEELKRGSGIKRF
jgi:hypothetical protein